MDLTSFYSDSKRLEYNPRSRVASKSFFKSMLAYDDRFDTVAQKLVELADTMEGNIRILDIGIGDGIYESMIYDKLNSKCDFYGVDISSKQIKRSKKFLKEGKVVDLDSKKLSYNNETFEIVIISEVLEHVFLPDNFINEAKRVLKKNGYLLLTYPNIGALQIRLSIMFGGSNPMINYTSNKEHIRFFNSHDIYKLVGLNRIYFQGLGSMFFDKWNFYNRIPIPKFLQTFMNRYLKTLALGHLAIYKK